MKKLTGFLSALVLAFGIIGTANATLHDRGAGLIYDDVLDITWVQDANLAGSNMSWSDAGIWAANLEYAGYDDWRVASSDVNGDGGIVGYSVPYSTEEACRDNELAYMYYYNLGGNGGSLTGNQTVGDVTINNIQSTYYWSSSVFTGLGVGFSFSFGGADSNHMIYLRTPWAVRDGDSSATIPALSEWGIIILFILLAGSALWMIRRKTGRESV